MRTMLARQVLVSTSSAPGVRALILLFAVGVGCRDNPCVRLAKVVCKCEQTESQQTLCTQEVDASAASDDPSSSAQDCCDALLSDCTCDELAHGHLAACGLVDPKNAAPNDWGPSGPPAQCSDFSAGGN